MFERTLIAERPAREMRRFRRTPLVVGVRLRWAGALGLETETSETRDTSRGGILVASGRERRAGSPVWVTLPFAQGENACVPEFPAHVAYSYFTASGAVRVGIAFNENESHQAHTNGNGHKNGARSNARFSLWQRAKVAIFGHEEKRRFERATVAVPILVRREDSPWPDEAISVNLSAGGFEFCSRQIYAPGEKLEAEVPDGRWAGAGRHVARVLRVGDGDGSLVQRVAAEFISG